MTPTPGLEISVGGHVRLVGSVLGEGGQGRVWNLTDATGRPVSALKWYHRNQATIERRHHVNWLIRGGPPSSDFVWPKDLIELDSGFGVLTALIPTGLRPLASMTGLGPTEAGAVGAALAGAVNALHLHGLCHRDLSATNVWANPSTGLVRIIDNDTAGTASQPSFGVRGTRSTTLDAVWEGRAPADAANDRYALAVLLHGLLDRHRKLWPPLEPFLDSARVAAGDHPEPLAWTIALQRAPR